MGRHGITTLNYVKEASKQILKIGGMFTYEGRKSIIKLDEDFIEKNISPGGSADLLAATIMLFYLEQ